MYPSLQNCSCKFGGIYSEAGLHLPHIATRIPVSRMVIVIWFPSWNMTSSCSFDSRTAPSSSHCDMSSYRAARELKGQKKDKQDRMAYMVKEEGGAAGEKAQKGGGRQFASPNHMGR